MKLRLKGDSIRLRLGPREVRDLLAGTPVTEETRFAPGRSLAFALAAAPGAAAVTATFADGRLTVAVPADVVRRWATSAEAVEIRGDQDAGGGRRLSILVEKDFECLHGEDADDAFPNPAQPDGPPGR